MISFLKALFALFSKSGNVLNSKLAVNLGVFLTNTGMLFLSIEFVTAIKDTFQIISYFLNVLIAITSLVILLKKNVVEIFQPKNRNKRE